MVEQRKRETAYKLRIGDILNGTPIVEQAEVLNKPEMPNEAFQSQASRERFRYLELGDKKIVRVNLIANVVEIYNAEGDKRYSSITIDDASGQVRVKVFGGDVSMVSGLSYGDTILTIGLLRSYNNELYVMPEIIKKVDARYLLIRKLELERNLKKEEKIEPAKATSVKEQIVSIIKSAEDNGASTEDIILKITSASPELINSEIVKLLEEGVIYEPRPGKVRYLG